MRPAPPTELSIVESARAEFRDHWQATRPLFPCGFEGARVDVEALDYLDYEGLGFPASGVAGSALVWGNVIATLLPFTWCVDDELGDLVLRSRCGELTIWPFGRVYESRHNSESQFDKYQRLMEWVVLQSLGMRVLAQEHQADALRLFADGESGLVEFVEYALGRWRELKAVSPPAPPS